VERAAGPLVSVVVPTYNRAHLVCEAIGSALAQTYRNVEVLVVDDGSTDGTRQALERRFGADPRMRVVAQEHGGPGPARNLGIRSTRGSLIAFLDSDDLWLPEKLARQVAQLRARPRAALSFCDARLEDAGSDGETRFRTKGFRGDTSLAEMVAINFAMCTSTTLVRRSVLDDLGAYDESLPCAQDWDLWIRVLARYPVVALDEVLAVIRRRPDSISRTRELEKWQSWLRIWLRHRGTMLEAGCPPATVRRKIAHAHKKVAQTLHAGGRWREARRHYLAWWRAEPWQLRGGFWWAALALKPPYAA
jgi:glycosyltransferase involved in cell wall biosynthesis